MLNTDKLISDLKKDDRKVQLILVALAVACFVALGVLLSKCSTPKPVEPSRPVVVPSVQAVAVATSSAQATASQAIRVTVKGIKSTKVKTPYQGPAAVEPTIPTAGEDFEIVIEATQSVATYVNAGASTSIEVSKPSEPTAAQLEHARLGVTVGLIPGVAAADLQLVKVGVPTWLFNTPLEISLDAEANHLQAGIGLSAGAKAYVTAGSYLTYGDWKQGYYLGLGLRF